MKDLKDALRSGMTPEQMRKDFEAQLAEASAEVAKERTAASKVNKARENVINAFIDYLMAIGLINEGEVDEADKKSIVKALQEVENEFREETKPFLDLIRHLANNTGIEKKTMSSDNIIQEFLRTL